MTPAEIAGRLIEEPYREPDECGLCDGAGGQRDMLTGDWLDCIRCEGLGVLHRRRALGARDGGGA